jgi:hypothetical protein
LIDYLKKKIKKRKDKELKRKAMIQEEKQAVLEEN